MLRIDSGRSSGTVKAAGISAAALLGLVCAADAQYAPVHPGPAWDAASNTGYQIPTLPAPGGCASLATGVGYANKTEAGAAKGIRALRWTPDGAVELGHLGTNSSGTTYCYIQSLHESGIAVGYANRYSGNIIQGHRAVRWAAGSTAATELGTLGTSGSGHANVVARSVNSFGAAVGSASKYSGSSDVGTRAVRWNAGTTLATQLGHLNTDSAGTTYSAAYDINDAGLAAGYAAKWGPSTPGGGDDGPPGTTGFIGQRPVKWNPGTTGAIELGHLGVNSVNYTDSNATRVNESGIIIGWSNKYGSGGTVNLGRRAVRWDPGSTVCIELLPPSTNPDGYTLCDCWAINDQGTIVGQANRYSGADSLGKAPVRWDAGGVEPTVLGFLGTDPAGGTDGAAIAINSHGLIAGYLNRYSESGVLIGRRAVIWGADGAAVDLNDLIDPASGWTALTVAGDITDTGWVTGSGMFDPDGAGPLASYSRMFILRVPPPHCPGDADGDGIAAFADVTAVLEAWGTDYGVTPFPGPGDADASGSVGFGDITEVLAHFGTSCF